MNTPSEEPMVTVPARTLIVTTENYGGYMAVKCVVCNSCGWEGQLKHTPECVVGKALVTQEVPC